MRWCVVPFGEFSARRYAQKVNVHLRCRFQGSLVGSDVKPETGTSMSSGKWKHERWEEKLEYLRRFKDEHGHANVPQNYRDKRLAKWVNKQREYRKKAIQDVANGKPSQSITPERIALLSEEGFVWDLFDETWNQRLNDLQEFIEEHGHANVPQHYPALGNWVKVQRTHFVRLKSGKPSPMTEQRKAALERVGFAFDPFEAAWRAKFAGMLLFKKQHGHVHVTKKQNKSLFYWLDAQKKQYVQYRDGQKCAMTEERSLLLEELLLDKLSRTL